MDFTALKRFLTPTAPDVDRARQQADKARAKAEAAAADAATRLAQANDEYARINYYTEDDFARYQTALREALLNRDASGLAPYVEFNSFQSTPPTPTEWAQLNAAQKADTKSPVRLFAGTSRNG